MSDRRMWIIFLIVFINLLGFGIILPLLPYYVESLGAGVIAIGFLSAAYSLFQLLSAPILGEMSDKWGRRPILIFSLIGTTLSFLLLGLSKTLPLLFLSRIIDGASGGNISTAQAYIADITSQKDRTQGMGFLAAAFGLGFILGPAFGGFLSRFGYEVPALAAAGVALFATILTYFFLPESLPKQKIAGVIPTNKKRKLIFSWKELYGVMTHPSVGIVVSVSFLLMLSFSLLQGTFAVFTEHTLGLTAEQNGYMFAYLGIIGVLLQLFFLKRILKRWAENKIVVVGIILMSVALSLIAASQSISTLLVALTFLAVANGISNPVLTGLVSKLSPEDEQGNIMGINQSVGSLARLIGPLVGTVIYDSFGPRSPYLIGAGMLFMTAMFAMKKLKSPTLTQKAS